MPGMWFREGGGERVPSREGGWESEGFDVVATPRRTCAIDLWGLIRTRSVLFLRLFHRVLFPETRTVSRTLRMR